MWSAGRWHSSRASSSLVRARRRETLWVLCPASFLLSMYPSKLSSGRSPGGVTTCIVGGLLGMGHNLHLASHSGTESKGAGGWRGQACTGTSFYKGAGAAKRWRRGGLTEGASWDAITSFVRRAAAGCWLGLVLVLTAAAEAAAACAAAAAAAAGQARAPGWGHRRPAAAAAALGRRGEPQAGSRLQLLAAEQRVGASRVGDVHLSMGRWAGGWGGLRGCGLEPHPSQHCCHSTATAAVQRAACDTPAAPPPPLLHLHLPTALPSTQACLIN